MMMGDICIIADVNITSLIDSPIGFPKTVYDIFIVHVILKGKTFFTIYPAKFRSTFLTVKGCDNCFCGKWDSVCVFFNHL